MAVTVEKRNEKFRLRYMYEGTRYDKTIPICCDTKLQKEKARFMMEVEEKNNPNSIMFTTFADKWLDEYAKNKLAKKTIHCYNQYLDTYIIPFFETYKLSDITTYELTRFLNTLTYLSTNSLKRYKALLSIIFNTAVKWDYLDYNPIVKVDLPKGKESNIKPTFLNQDEVNALLHKLDSVDIKYQVIVLLALKCGLRRSEILGLSWDNVDFNNKTITVDKSLSYTSEDGTFIADTKNNSSKRTIYVAEDVLKKIKKLPKKNELLFGLLNPDAVTRWFGRFLRNNNLKKIRFHDLRHTHATLLIANNINIKTVSARLGHSQVSTTLNIYTHSLSEEDKKASMII